MSAQSLITAALIAGLASTAAASAANPSSGTGFGHPISGYLELFGQGAWNSPNASYNPWFGAGAAARANIWLAPMWSGQVDLSGNTVSSGSLTDGAISTLTAAAHVDYRDPATGLLGGFLGLTSTNDYWTTGQDGSWFAGVEAQRYWNNFTLYGQAGFLNQFSGTYGGPGDPDQYTISIWFAQLTGRLFPQPDTKLEASVGFIGGPIWGTVCCSDYRASSLTFAAEIEHRFDSHPFSIFARVNGFSDPNYTNGAAFQYAAMAGIRLNFGAGTGTLEDQDRRGATLKVPDFDPIGWLRFDDY